jgi:hypothetical protein
MEAGRGVLKDGITKVVTKSYVEDFDLQAKSILIYSDKNQTEVNRIFSA